MSNIEAFTRLVNGDVMPIHEDGAGCDLFIERLHGDDLRPPPRQFELYIATASGKKVRVVVPNKADGEAVVYVDDELV